MNQIWLKNLRFQIDLEMRQSTYDHKLLMPQSIKDKFPHMIEDNQLIYSRFKYAVAKVLGPTRIYEVGVGWGVAAKAFIEGYPETDFYGIDTGEMGVDPAYAMLYSDGDWQTAIADSNDISAFTHPRGSIDLLHLDGGHGIQNKINDIVKAIEARPQWLLIDDIHNVQVAAGVFAGLYKAHACPDISMLMFEHSHTGNLLIHTAGKEPAYRELEIKLV